MDIALIGNEPATLPDMAHETGAEPQCLSHSDLGQIVLVLQGGGALGAYQGGVFQALMEGGIAPDWVIGTSIGAINAAIIAGNPPERRLERLNIFWQRIRHDPVSQMFGLTPWFGSAAANAMTTIAGVKGFFVVYKLLIDTCSRDNPNDSGKAYHPCD